MVFNFFHRALEKVMTSQIQNFAQFEVEDIFLKSSFVNFLFYPLSWLRLFFDAELAHFEVTNYFLSNQLNKSISTLFTRRPWQSLAALALETTQPIIPPNQFRRDHPWTRFVLFDEPC